MVEADLEFNIARHLRECATCLVPFMHIENALKLNPENNVDRMRLFQWALQRGLQANMFVKDRYVIFKRSDSSENAA